ncbi:hypothetical protein AWE51_04375 [Aquimarina aggregata]|uniref:Peptidase M1 membrane alanine aminopeptidase domain-containing protein n=1 Tax=Aquimarina aggregata TaxID=1642818 RepID=A0A163CRN7_9FLAO|nr:M1 family metallopeptidase [Aquimarina aggregata]KZS42692.1 hypothetical protein AWE51_04375 [Aquimarina aggregata]
MKLKIFILSFSFIILSNSINAQSDLHIPREIQSAYEKQTRSKDGKPGEKYWQNEVNYKIDVAVTPSTRLINGKEVVEFTNNSPDDLSEVVIRLYYDVFKKGNARSIQVNEKDIGEGTIIKSVIVEGVKYDLSDRKQIRRIGTNMSILLAEPLKTGKKITLQFEWQQKVPLTLRRTGAVDETSFFIGYWYPQVAVYDDIFGWDKIDYTFTTEFYNNLSSFDVNITAPDNFLVWATGTLQNSADILPTSIHKKYLKAQSSKDVINIVTSEELKNLKLKSGTWNYKATEVTDFAFAMSDHYLWDAAVEKVKENNVLINTAFPVQEIEKYKEVTHIQQKIIKHFTYDVPGVPYPYPQFTTFIGLKNRGSGMEFPMMANNGGPGKPLTIHELFHSYFPMYVRINERRFAWMDEGWADFIEILTMHKFFNDKKEDHSFYSKFKLGVQRKIGSISSLPAVTSTVYTTDNYGYHAYSLPSFTYALLYQHLGEKKFLKCLKTYIERWAKKSPTPYDFFYTFENVSGEDLSFFWNSWYFKMGYPDLKIESFNEGNLIIKRIGERPVPISLKVAYDSINKKSLQNYSSILGADIWKNNNRTLTIKIPNFKKIESIVINSDFPDFNESDNFYPSLSNQYESLNLDNSILGIYPIEEFPMELLLSKKEGVLMFELLNTSIKAYLQPLDKYSFVSIDGTISLKILKEKYNKHKVELNLSLYDRTFTGIQK